MSAGLQTIMQRYAANEDPAVRRNLCNALVAARTPEAAELLLDLATQDSDESVNTLASDQIAGLNLEQLKAIQPTLAKRFDPKKGKDHILNWVRSADRIAKGTRTSLFAGMKSWWHETRATRRLNRRLLFSRKNEFSFASRLINRYMLISSVLSVFLSGLLMIVMVTNPDDALINEGLSVAFAAVLLLGIPLAVMFAPPTLAFRRSVISYVDAMTVIKFLGIPTALIGVISASTMAEDSWEFFGPMILYLILPLVLVRVALNAAMRLRQRLAYPLALCLIALGVLVAVYSVELWVLDATGPYWYEYGNLMSGFLTITVPISLFMALYQGSHGNVVTLTGETPASLFYNKVRWMSLAGLGLAFCLVAAIAPSSGLTPPGRGNVVQKDLAVTDTSNTPPNQFMNAVLASELAAISAGALTIATAVAEEGSNRQLVSFIEEEFPELSADSSFRQIREIADGLVDALYAGPISNNDMLDAVLGIADDLYAISERIASAEPVGDTLRFNFGRTDRIVLNVPSEGEFEMSVTALRNDRTTDVVIWVNNTQIDERDWSDPEFYQDYLTERTLTLIADVPARSTDMTGVVSHFQTKIAYVMNLVPFLAGQSEDSAERETVDLVFTAEINWRPIAQRIDTKSGPRF
ncbi:MAG: HEAT repeat domain-containing protein [Pseudomonadota bacterium]